MPKQLVPDTAQFKVVLQYEAVNNTIAELMTGFYVRNTLVPWTATTLGAMATTIGNAFRDQVMPLIASAYRMDRVDTEDLGADPGLQTSHEYNTVGGDGGSPVSSVLCLLVTAHCSPGALPKEGRSYVPGGSVNSIGGNLWTTGFRDGVVTAYGVIRSQIEGGANEQVIVSRFLNNVKRAQGVTNDVQSFSGRTLVATQRDRRL